MSSTTTPGRTVIVVVVVVGELVDNITLGRPLRVGMDGQSHLLNVLVAIVARLIHGRLLLLLLLSMEEEWNSFESQLLHSLIITLISIANGAAPLSFVLLVVLVVGGID